MSSPCALPGLLPPILGGYAGKHVAPSTLAPGARTALAAGLAFAVLPLGATSALAEDNGAGSVTSAVTETVTGVTGPTEAVSSEAVTAESVTAESLTAGTGTTETDASTPAAGEAVATEATDGADEAGEAAVPTAEAAPVEEPVEDEAEAAPARSVRASSLVRLSAPRRDADGRVPVAVRLLADGEPVRNGSVRLERSTGQGWSYAGRLLTDASGLGAGTLRLPATTTLRAVYVGSEVRTPTRSTVHRVVVDLVKAGSTGAGLAVRGATVLSQARSQVGKPYVFGATGPSAFDCSGFTRWVYAKVGKSLPHNSAAQERATTRVSKAQAKPGDLIFLKGVRGHVGIYAGNGRMYDAPRAGKDVTLRRIWTSNYVVGRVS